MIVLGRVLMALLLTLVAVIVGFFLMINAMDNDRARRYLIAPINDKTGIAVAIEGEIETKFFRYLEFTALDGQAAASRDQQHKPGWETTWERVYVRIDPWELLFGRFAIEDLQINRSRSHVRPRLLKAAEPQAPKEPMNLPVSVNIRKLKLENISLDVEGGGSFAVSDLTGYFRLEDGDPLMSLDSELNVGTVDIDLYETEQGQAESKQDPVTQMFAAMQAPPLLVDSFRITTKRIDGLPLTIADAVLTAQLTDDEAKLKTSVGDPQASGSIVIEMAKHRIGLDGSVQQVKVGPLVNQMLGSVERAAAAKKPPGEEAAIERVPESIKQDIVTGDLRARVTLETTGNTVSEVTKNLNGDIFVYLNKGTLDATVVELLGIDVAESVLSFLANDPNTPLYCLIANLKIKQGLIDGDQVAAVTRDSQLKGEGQIDLNDQQIDYTIMAFAEDVSPLSLPAPIHIRGSLQEPKFSVAQESLVKEALTSVFQPVAALVEWFREGEKVNLPEQCATLLGH